MHGEQCNNAVICTLPSANNSVIVPHCHCGTFKQKNLRHLIMLKFLTMSTKSGIFPTFGLFFIYFYLSLTFSFVAPPRPRYFDHFFVILALNLIHFPISKETCLNRSDHNYSSSGIKVRSCVQKWQEDAQTALFFIFFSYSAKEILKLK